MSKHHQDPGRPPLRAQSTCVVGHVRAWPLGFRQAQPGHVSLCLYDLKGRCVKRYVDREMPAGDHEITLDGEGLASGVYYYRLEANGQEVGKRCILIK